MDLSHLQFLTHSPRNPLVYSCCNNRMSFGLFLSRLSVKLNGPQENGGCGPNTLTTRTDYPSGPRALVLEEVLQEVRKWHDCSSGSFSKEREDSAFNYFI